MFWYFLPIVQVLEKDCSSVWQHVTTRDVFLWQQILCVVFVMSCHVIPLIIRNLFSSKPEGRDLGKHVLLHSTQSCLLSGRVAYYCFSEQG